MPQLYQLLFTSVATIDLDDEELYEILKQSAAHNTRNRITGLLTFRDGVFLEKLEGEKTVVLDTYERICKDGRHTEVATIIEGEIEERRFSDYRMCFETDFEKTIRQTGHYVNQEEAADILSRIENPTRCVVEMLTMIC